MKICKADAIRALEPNSSFVVFDDVRIEWNSPDITQPTETQINDKIKELEQLEPYRLLRIERNRRLQETDWRASSDLIMSNEWKTYRQALRDLPKVHPVNYGDPKLDSDGRLDMSSVTWPTPPS